MKRSEIETTTLSLKSAARRLGFQLAGVCPAVVPSGIHRFYDWLDAGYAGQMRYLEERRDAYEHPRHVLDGVTSILMLGMSYSSQPTSHTGPGQGRVARYAWGERDYHDLIHDRLKQLIRQFQQLVPEARARGVVDTAPLLEREFAQLAGLGWAAKNTLIINPSIGSYFFLAAMLTDVELAHDHPAHTDHCGTCTACLDACPTNAFPQPYVLDANKCISYLTIELRDAIPHELRANVGDWLFGCDICQDVCPWNRRAPDTDEPGFRAQPIFNPLELADLFSWTDHQFRQHFRKTPLWRSKRRGLLRNAAIVLGNQKAVDASMALVCGLSDAEPLVRAACAWALGEVGTDSALAGLRARSAIEHEACVIVELDLALGADRR